MANQPKKYTKFVATAATATLVASAIVPVASASFSDVAETNSHAVNINALVEAGIIGGYADGTFKPNQDLTRGQVVKMLGKWVEAQGHTIPADYATVARFTDVAVDAKDQELVKYAALVKDTGVFNGSNGALNAAGKITRENMAVTLDRAFKAVNGTSLVELAADIEDVTVADLATAKEEARTAIQAVRDLGISGVENFNPKAAVTRGQFASFLNKTINVEVKAAELTVKTAVATSATTLEVVLSDDSKHTVTLPTALEANKATTVTFTIGEKEYTAEVTYVLDVKTATVVDATTLEVVLTDDTKHEVALTSPLEANKATTVTFKINGVDYTTTVTYVVTDLAVTSVQATNSQIVVTFSKAIDKDTVVQADGTLVDGVVKIDGTLVNTYIAELSKDGKTLTLTPAAETAFAEGVYKFEIAANTVETEAGEQLKAFQESFRVAKDTTRPEITGVTATSKYVYEVKFSEPVTDASAKAFTASYKNTEVETTLTAPVGNLSKDGKTLTLTFAPTTEVNEEINILFSGLTDFAGNKAVPTTKSVTISDADKTKPEVTSITATSATTMEIKVSEKVANLDASKITFKGAAVVKAEVSDKDATIIVVEVASTITTGTLEIAKNAFEDLSGNTNAAKSQTVYFNADKTAPTLTSSTVKKVNNNNVLVLKFSEKVTENVTSDLTLKYVDEYGVTQSVVVPAANLSVDADDATKVNVELTKADASAVKVDVNYTIEFAAASFTDLFTNDSAKFSVSFKNTGAAISTNKLEVVSVTPATVGQRTTEGSAFVDVVFNNAVDLATAKNAANYTVEGATVTSVELTANNPAASTATVRVFITNETVELTGTYNVTVSNVKGYSSDVTVMDVATEGVTIAENVTAVVKKAVIKNATDVELTFSEAVSSVDGTDFEFFVDGKKVTATITASASSEVVTVSVTDKDIYELIADGKKVELRAASTINIADAAGNVTSFKAIEVK
ncbi:S-layer homology domain-containing protein [Solibacillus sp. FSL H8-0538]|uniref:S-layer homology domain-containing protein n=1 Tax=Solibacillus sp. FSL H8-0538 TaxID=2921400 RepID=UPI0030FBAC5F